MNLAENVSAAPAISEAVGVGVTLVGIYLWLRWKYRR